MAFVAFVALLEANIQCRCNFSSFLTHVKLVYVCLHDARGGIFCGDRTIHFNPAHVLDRIHFLSSGRLAPRTAKLHIHVHLDIV